MVAYYNEFDPFAAAWLEQLIADGHIAPGYVDTRDLWDVPPCELREFTQVHLCAGIGGWSYALRLAGIPDDYPVWTASFPCQPFSAAGKGAGVADDRHLWPAGEWHIRFNRPSVIFGEQVASRLGREWFAGIRADLEGMGYAVGAADLCAAGVGAPHIRQRLYWLAQPDEGQCRRVAEYAGERDGQTTGRKQGDGIVKPRSENGERLADAPHADGRRRERRPETGIGTDGKRGRGFTGGSVDDLSERLGGSNVAGSQGRRERPNEHADKFSAWAASIFIPCIDGKSRRVPVNEAGEPEPLIFPLVNGFPNRVGTLRGAGNAVTPELAAEFIKATLHG